MIRVAASELKAQLIRAARGRGVSQGIAEEFARAVLTLHSAGQNGTALGLAALQGPPPRPARLTRTGCLGGNSALYLGPALADFVMLGPTLVEGAIPDARLLLGYLLASHSDFSFGPVRACGGRLTYWPDRMGLPQRVRLYAPSPIPTPRHGPPYTISTPLWAQLGQIGLGALVPVAASEALDAGAGAIDND